VADQKDVIFFHEEVDKALVRAEAIEKQHFGTLVELFNFAANSVKSHDKKSESEFFDKLWTAACDVVQFAANRRNVAPIPITAFGEPPFEWARSLYQKIEYLRQQPNTSKVVFDGTAIRAIVDAVQGKCELVTRPARDKNSRLPGREADEIVAVWKTPLPAGREIWLEDGSVDPDDIRDALHPLGVINTTPSGIPRRQKLVVQIRRMIRNGTKPSVVRRIIRSVLARIPDDAKVGVIANRKHVAAINRLRREFPNQIERISYFRSGEDTGSNGWLDCNVLLIVGTPFVPPRAIQKELIRRGNLDAANRDGRWGDRYWYGQSLSGEQRLVRSRGYCDEDWHQAYRAVVRSKLIQAVERSRSYLPTGVPLSFVFSTEPLALPLADTTPWQGITRKESRLFKALCVAAETAGLSLWGSEKDGDSASARVCIDNRIQEVADILAAAFGRKFSATETPERGIRTVELAKQIGLSERTVREQVRGLAKKGFAQRIGQRKGWMPIVFA